MDLVNKIKNLKDQELKEKGLQALKQTLERNDEEFYFEEETIEIAGRNYINKRLKKENGFYFFRDDLKKETAYCITCWDTNGQLNKVKKNGNTLQAQSVCLVCELSKKS